MQVIKGHALLARLASGSLGDLHLARRRPEEDAPRAIRLIRPELAQDLKFARLLFAESGTARVFDHPGAVRILDVGRDGGALYVATELVGGQSLAVLMQRLRVEGRSLDQRIVLWIGAQVASVLAEAHRLPWFAGAAAPMVHGALAPRSIHLGYEGDIRILGLGYGRARLQVPTPLARLPYLAPELLQDKEVSARTDIYCLGLSLYDALAGKVVFRRATADETRQAIRDAQAVPLGPRALKVDGGVGTLLQAMMAPRVEARPADLAEIEGQLRAWSGLTEAEVRETLVRELALLGGAERDVWRRLVEAASKPDGAPLEPSATDAEVDATDTAPITFSEAPLVAEEIQFDAPVDWSVTPSTTLPDRPTNRSPFYEVSAISGEPPLERQPLVMEPDARARVGRYRTESLIGRSATTTLLRCRDPNLDRTVVVKLLDPEHLLDPRLERAEWLRLFKQEGRLVARLRHEGLPLLLDAGRDGESFFLAFEYVAGETLASVLGRGRRLESEAVRDLVLDLAGALHHLHARGVVHGDVRPANVILTASGARLLDLSLAMERGGPEHPLLLANVMTHAPEYLEGQGYGPAADQFALGMLLYQVLVGTRPFRGLEDIEVQRAMRVDRPKSPAEVDPSVDPALSALAMRLLEKDPALRFPSCEVLQDVLKAERLGMPAALTAPPLPKSRSHPEIVADLAPEVGRWVDTVLVDDLLDPLLARRLFAERGISAVAYASLSEALAALEQHQARRLLVARSVVQEEWPLRRRLEAEGRKLELVFIPDLGARLMGPPLDPITLARAWVTLVERVGTLSALDIAPAEDAVAAARVVARRVAPTELRVELVAALGVAVRDLAARMRASVFGESMAPLVPHELQAALAAVERLASDPPSAELLALPVEAHVVAAVEAYFGAVRPRDGRLRSSPRRAVMALREIAPLRIRNEVVDALLEHLGEVISALDLSADLPPRVLVAGRAQAEPLVRGLEMDGWSVDLASEGVGAWERLQRFSYHVVVVDHQLPGRDGPTLLELARGLIQARDTYFFILSGSVEAARQRLAGQRRFEILGRSEPLEAIRGRVSQLIRGERQGSSR